MDAFLKKADILHTRLVEDSRVRTSRGGFLFLLACSVSLALALSSLARYFSGGELEFVERIEVDTQLSHRMPIELDITFSRLSCIDIELVAVDISGEAQIDAAADLKKYRLDEKGVPIGDSVKATLNKKKELAVAEIDNRKKTVGSGRPCGSCYGAERGPGDCCQTCHDVKERYAQKGWDVQKVAREAEQCLHEMDHPEIAYQPNEGCRLVGTLFVNKIAGNIHVALGTSQKIGGQVYQTFIRDQMGRFDTSHIIDRVRFGDANVAGDVGQLDGTQVLVDKSRGLTAAIQHHVHLIPIRYRNSVFFKFTKTTSYIPILEPEEKTVLSTDGARRGQRNKMARMYTLPGMYIMYDFSPFVIVRERYQIPLIDLITDLLTIAGGVFALVRLLDSALYMTGL